MLTFIKKRLSLHSEAITSGFYFLALQPMATVMTLLVMAIALTLPGLMHVVLSDVKSLNDNWQQNGRISVYLDASLSEQKQTSLQQEIKNMPGVGHVRLISQQEGLNDLLKQEGMNDVMQYLPDNPLLPVIEISPSTKLYTDVALNRLVENLSALSGVHHVKLDLDWLKRLHAFIRFLNQLANGLFILLSLAVLLIIGNTLRLVIHNRHLETQTLMLIGATRGFIARPFLYAGMIFGFLGGVLAIFMINILLLLAKLAFEPIAVMYDMSWPLHLPSIATLILFLFFATLLGWLGAVLAIYRQIASIDV